MNPPAASTSTVNEQALLELIHSKTPEELTLGEIEALRAALPHSPELQQALASQLQMDQYLADALGRVRVSVDEILAQAAGASRSPARTWPAGWAILIAAIAIGGLLFWVIRRESGREDNIIAKTLAPSEETKTSVPKKDLPQDGSKKEEEKGTAGKRATSASLIQTPPGGDAATTVTETSGSATRANAGPEAFVASVTDTQPQATNKSESADRPNAADESDEPIAEVEPPRPTGPWDASDHLGGKVLPLDASAFPGPSSPPDPKQLESLRQWFEAVPGANYQMQVDQAQATLQGLARLKAPWDEGAVLRLELATTQGFKIHVWHAQDGVTLAARQPAPDHTWAALATRRSAQEALPTTYTLTATDGGRAWRTGDNGNQPGTRIDLRYEQGELILARGDVRLLAAPLAGRPRAIYFEGKVPIRAIRMFRGEPLPPEQEPARAVEAKLAEPAEADWLTQLPPGATLEPMPDKRVRLVSAGAEQLATAAWKLPPGGIREIVFEVSEFTSGGGVFLGDENGQPFAAARFFKDKNSRSGQLALGYPPLTDQTFETPLDPNSIAHGFAADRAYIRLQASAGRVRFWLSADGRNWAQIGTPQRLTSHDVRSVGILCGPVKQPCAIALDRIEVREYQTINDLAPPDLVRQAPAMLTDHLARWLERVIESQPSGTEPGQWQRACAVRSLACGAHPALTPHLTRQLLADVDVPAGDIDRWQQVAAAVASVADTWLASEGSIHPQWFEQRAAAFVDELFAGGEAVPFRRLFRPLVTLPIWTHESYKLPLGDVARQELLALGASQRWAEVGATAQMLYTYGHLGFAQQNQQLALTAKWAQATAAERGAAEPLDDDAAVLAPHWRHPLSIELSKEGFNVLAELEVALANKAYKDACQIVATAPGAGAFGLLPSGKDTQLWSSFPLAVADTMRRIPALQQAMRDQFGDVGALRVKESITVGDASALEMATVQFFGTPAAALAHFWLGDRALSAGDFIRSIRHYRQAEVAADPAIRKQLAAHRRLAAALAGDHWGEPVTYAVSLGESKLTADRFEALVQESLQRQRVSAAAAEEPNSAPHRIRGSLALAPTPPPGNCKIEARGKLDQIAGAAPGPAQQSAQSARVDWVARTFGGLVDGDILYYSDGAHARAWNLKSGQPLWQANITGPGGSAQQVQYGPIHPVLADQRLIVRRRIQQGYGIVALNASSGQPLWQAEGQRDSTLTSPAISDPLIVDDEVLVLTAAAQGRYVEINLAAYDVATGNQKRSTPISRFGQSWTQYPTCSIMQAGDAVLAVLGGSVFCLDPQGDVRWIRRESWLTPDLTSDWAARTCGPPLVSGSQLYLSAIGSVGLSCVDVLSGKLLWRNALLASRRVVGRAGDVVVVETDNGLAGLSIDDGTILWRHAADGRLDAVLAPGAGGVAYTRRVAANDPNQFHVELVWLNPASGETTANTILFELKDSDPAFGPVLAADSGLYALFGRGNNQLTREVLALSFEPGELTAQAAPPLVTRWTEEPLGPVNAAAVAVLSGWGILSTDVGNVTGLLPEHGGRRNVLALKPASNQPVRFARWVSVPKGGQTSVRLQFAAHPAGACIVQVRAGDTTLWRKKISGSETGGAWQEAEIDLTPFGGQSLWIQVQQPPTGQTNDETYWAAAEIKTVP